MTEKSTKKVSSPIPDKTQHAIIAAFKSGLSLTKTAARFGVSRHAVTRIVRGKNVLPPPTPKAAKEKKMSDTERLELLRERVERVFGSNTPMPEQAIPTGVPVEGSRANIPTGMRVVDYNRMREAHVFEEAYEHIRRTTAAAKPQGGSAPPTPIPIPETRAPVWSEADIARTLRTFQKSLLTISDLVANVTTALNVLVDRIENP